MRPRARATTCAALAAALATPAAAQDPPRRECRIGVIAPAAAPRIDGLLTDPCWKDAPAIGDLVQREPLEDAPPSQRTVVRILHDERQIYLAIECFDSDPAGIRATQRARDAELDPDDRVEWLFDTFDNRQQAYWFQIGAAGSLGDALISSHGGFLKAWDTIWDGRARVTADGWQAEVAIPFQSLAFAPGQATWGFNCKRERRANNETDVWSEGRVGESFYRVVGTGVLGGFGKRSQGLGLDVKPQVVFGERRTRAVDQEWAGDLDTGLDLFFRLSPGIGMALTTFTDFAETEVDDRRINLTRFPLFFPEKRDFFLADSARFDFGPRANSQTLVPFFSRRVGRAPDGQQVPILAGLKVAGQAGPWDVGVLDVETDAGGGVDERRNLGVVRVRREVGADAVVGLVATHGAPTGDAENAVLGADVSQRLAEFLGGADLRWSLYALGSHRSGAGGDGAAFGFDAAGEARLWSYTLGARHIGAEFDPALGFVRRTGVEQGYASLGWTPRPGGGPVRNWIVELGQTVDFDRHGGLVDRRTDLVPLGVRLLSDDSCSLHLVRQFERVDETFAIFAGRMVPAGDYESTRCAVEIETSPGRPLSLELGGGFGELYDGHSQDSAATLAWRTGALLILGAGVSTTHAVLPDGRFTAHAEEGRLDLHFTSALSWRNLVQYDNESRNLGVQSRVRWILAPGSDLFVVVGAGWQRQADGSMLPDEQALTVKLTHTLRF